LLGVGHPLVRDLERLALVRRQSLVVAVVFVGGVAGLYEGSPAAAALIAAAVATQLLLAGRAVVVRESRRTHVLELISEGHSALPIPAVEQMCRRLRDARHRRRLARSVEAFVNSEIGRFDVVTMPWRFMRSAEIATIRNELIAIAVLLRDDGAGLAGIAMIERLLGDGTSSLHGDDLEVLREDLRRTRFLLGVRARPG
jgi:hypothetical protein